MYSVQKINKVDLLLIYFLSSTCFSFDLSSEYSQNQLTETPNQWLWTWHNIQDIFFRI